MWIRLFLQKYLARAENWRKLKSINRAFLIINPPFSMMNKIILTIKNST